MQITLFAECQHPLCERLGGLGFCEGGLDAAMLDEAAYLVRKQRITVCLASAEFDGFFSMTHGVCSLVSLIVTLRPARPQ